ncbi:MAG: nucleotidyltransferase domain-containing protein [Elusimicrobia bacterium]|nr:nucleotidyltransferase domain-containing protein [Elusimicrobiota bacterium]
MKQIKAILQKLLPFSPRLIYLFGSAARSELRFDSDFDLAVLTKKLFPPADRYRSLFLSTTPLTEFSLTTLISSLESC